MLASTRLAEIPSILPSAATLAGVVALLSRKPCSPKHQAMMRMLDFLAALPVGSPVAVGCSRPQLSTSCQNNSAHRSSPVRQKARTSGYTKLKRLNSQINLMSPKSKSRILDQ